MRKRVGAFILLLVLLMGACGPAQESLETATVQEIPPTAAPTPKPTPEPLLYRGDEAEAEKVFREKWYSGGEVLESFSAAGRGDIMALYGNELYIIQKNRVGVYHLENGGFYSLSPIDIGFYWLENRDENGWVGCEKTPLELFVSAERLVVLSAWAEYSETYANDVRTFADHSRTVLDIFDISNPSDPQLVASYGQDGGQCAGYADSEGNFWLLSRRSVYEADYATPAVHNSEHRIELEADHIDVHAAGRSQAVVLGLYDLVDGIRKDARALMGGGEMALLGESGAYILGGETNTHVIHYAMDDEEIALPLSVVIEGTLLDAALSETEIHMAVREKNAVVFSALSHELEAVWERELSGDALSWGFGTDCFRLLTEESLQILNLSDRSLREGELFAARVERLDEKHWITLDYQPDGGNLELVLLRAGAKGTVREAKGTVLGYNYRPALEEARCLWLSDGLLALGSETGCSFYSCGNDGFIHRQDVFTADNSAHMRFFKLGEYLYVADSREVHALRLRDLVFVGEWFL